MTAAKPTAGRIEQQTNVAVVKGQQQKTTSMKASQPDAKKQAISSVNVNAGKRGLVAVSDEDDDDDDQDDDDDSEDDDNDDDEGDDDDSVDDDDDD